MRRVLVLAYPRTSTQQVSFRDKFYLENFLCVSWSWIFRQSGPKLGPTASSRMIYKAHCQTPRPRPDSSHYIDQYKHQTSFQADQQSTISCSASIHAQDLDNA